MPSEKPQDEVEKFFNTHLKSYVEFERHWADVMARFLTKLFGSVWFLTLTIILIGAWITLNSGWLPGTHPFDPYPFSLLVMAVSFSELLLAIVVLINQNRQGNIADIRQRIDFEINVRAEREITKILKMIEELRIDLGIEKADRELETMKEKINIAEIKEEIELGMKKEEVG